MLILMQPNTSVLEFHPKKRIINLPFDKLLNRTPFGQETQEPP